MNVHAKLADAAAFVLLNHWGEAADALEELAAYLGRLSADLRARENSMRSEGGLGDRVTIEVVRADGHG